MTSDESLSLMPCAVCRVPAAAPGAAGSSKGPTIDPKVRALWTL